METVKSESGNTYAVRPSFKQKSVSIISSTLSSVFHMFVLTQSRVCPYFGNRFPVFKVKEVIRETLAQQLGDVEYHIDHSSKLTSTLADAIKNNLKSLNLERWVHCRCSIVLTR